MRLPIAALGLALAALLPHPARACRWADEFHRVVPDGAQLVPSNVRLLVEASNAEALVATLELDAEPPQRIPVERVAFWFGAVPLTIPVGSTAVVRLTLPDARAPVHHQLLLRSTGQADLTAPSMREAPSVRLEARPPNPCWHRGKVVMVRVAQGTDDLAIAGYLVERITDGVPASKVARSGSPDADQPVELEFGDADPEGACYRVVALDLAGNRGESPVACIPEASELELELDEVGCACRSSGSASPWVVALLGAAGLARHLRRARRV